VAVYSGRAVLVLAAPGGPVQQVIAVAPGRGQHGGPQQAEQFAGADRDESAAGGRGGGTQAGDGEDCGGNVH